MHSKRRSRVVQQAFSLQSFLESALFLANLMELLKLQPSKNPTQQNILLKRRENVTRNFQQQKLSILKILLSIRATKSKKVLIFFYKHRAFSSTCVFLFSSASGTVVIRILKVKVMKLKEKKLKGD